jgi:hypothetical protein
MKTDMISNREKIINNIVDILDFLNEEIKDDFGKFVCAGGAVRDLTIGEGMEPKDYDVYIICGGRQDLFSIEKSKHKIISILDSLIISNKIKENPEATKPYDEKSPIKNFIYNDCKIQLMYRPEVVGEYDLIEDFDWNFCSCFISKQKDKFVFGHGGKFPAPLFGGTPFHFSNAKEFLSEINNYFSNSKIEEENAQKLLSEPEPNTIFIELNDNHAAQRDPFYSFIRACNFASKYRKIYEKVDFSRKSFYSICDQVCSKKSIVGSLYNKGYFNFISGDTLKK